MCWCELTGCESTGLCSGTWGAGWAWDPVHPQAWLSASFALPGVWLHLSSQCSSVSLSASMYPRFTLNSAHAHVCSHGHGKCTYVVRMGLYTHIHGSTGELQRTGRDQGSSSMKEEAVAAPAPHAPSFPVLIHPTIQEKVVHAKDLPMPQLSQDPSHTASLPSHRHSEAQEDRAVAAQVICGPHAG